jgi:hypothetical protein
VSDASDFPARDQLSSVALEQLTPATDVDPVTISAIAVQYGLVDIGGKKYVCSIQGIAVFKVHHLVMETVDGVGLEKHINLLYFLNYHKFGSTSRILPK